MDIEGASILVTGGASGIGEASAWKLAERGARIAIADLNEERGSDVASRLDGVFVQTDVTNPDQVQAAIDESYHYGNFIGQDLGVVYPAEIGAAICPDGTPFPVS